MKYDYLIVGAGFFGSTFAWHAARSGKRVLVIDKRDHVGGNCYTRAVEGIQVHVYGPHIFHTSDPVIWDFVNRFATFNSYVHRVKARHGDRVLSLPINLTTLNQLWGTKTPEEAATKLQQVRRPLRRPKNMEEWALSQVGTELYETLFKHYTTKQWGRDPSQLPASILKRLPLRTSFDDSYFNDRWQGIPIGGYTQIFEGLLECCDVQLGCDYLTDAGRLRDLAKRVLYTGPIDEYFSYQLGALEYRTLSFETRVLDVPDHQGCAQLNWTGPEVPWTRTIEHRHFEQPKAQHNKTIVTWETPATWHLGAEPFYPINDDRNKQLYMKYVEMAKQSPHVIFGGRLGRYVYWDMHQAIAAAMQLAKREGLCS